MTENLELATPNPAALLLRERLFDGMRERQEDAQTNRRTDPAFMSTQRVVYELVAVIGMKLVAYIAKASTTATVRAWLADASVPEPTREDRTQRQHD